MTMHMKTYFRQVVCLSTGSKNVDDAIYNYLLYGLSPGSFTTAVLENNLLGAASLADQDNLENLVFIARAVGAQVPIIAWGSPEKVKNWLNDEDGRRTDYRNWVLEEATMLKLKDQ